MFWISRHWLQTFDIVCVVRERHKENWSSFRLLWTFFFIVNFTINFEFCYHTLVSLTLVNRITLSFSRNFQHILWMFVSKNCHSCLITTIIYHVGVAVSSECGNLVVWLVYKGLHVFIVGERQWCRKAWNRTTRQTSWYGDKMSVALPEI